MTKIPLTIAVGIAPARPDFARSALMATIIAADQQPKAIALTISAPATARDVGLSVAIAPKPAPAASVKSP